MSFWMVLPVAMFQKRTEPSQEADMQKRESLVKQISLTKWE